MVNCGINLNNKHSKLAQRNLGCAWIGDFLKMEDSSRAATNRLISWMEQKGKKEVLLLFFRAAPVFSIAFRHLEASRGGFQRRLSSSWHGPFSFLIWTCTGLWPELWGFDFLLDPLPLQYAEGSFAFSHTLFQRRSLQAYLINHMYIFILGLVNFN